MKPMKHQHSLNLKASKRQLYKGECTSILDEFEDYEPQIPGPFITAKTSELKAKEDLLVDYTLGNSSYFKKGELR